MRAFRPKLGLRVQHCNHVERVAVGGFQVLATTPAGWYIHAKRGKYWQAIMDLRFVREKDALRAVKALTAAGLNSYGALKRADCMMVKEIACRDLQW